MNAISNSTVRPNETGSLWLWTNDAPIIPVQTPQFNLLVEAKPLLIRLAIIALVVGLASFLPEEKSAEVAFIQSTEGLNSTPPEPMAQLILEPVAAGQNDLEPSDERTDRHAVPDFRFTRFSDSWIDFKF